MATKTRVTRKQAEAALKAIEAQYAPYVQEGYGPTLHMDWDGYVAIIWEEGPYEWTYTARHGGHDEELSILAGQPMQTPAATDWPEGVWCEPYNTCVLCLYPQD